MKIDIIVNNRCAGLNHYHLTVTVKSENDQILLVKDITLTMDDIIGVDPIDAVSTVPILLRQLFLQQGFNRNTPLLTMKTAIEATEFRV